MGRAKAPEETRELILDTAAKLFVEKGYEQTSIQDIINQLGGLSKGAIYYHFPSKEAILWAVIDRIYAGSDRKLREICRRDDLSGIEKLQAIFRDSMDAAGAGEREAMTEVTPGMLDNPKFLALFLKNSVQGEGPQMLLSVIEEGLADGSVNTAYPKELAEVLALLANFWINPFIYPASEEDMIRKLGFFADLTKRLGLDLVDDEMTENFTACFAKVYGSKE